MKTLKIAITLSTIILAACTQKPIAPQANNKNNPIKIDRWPADTEIVQSALPPVYADEKLMNKIWSTYCGGDRVSTEIPMPNYSNREVTSAARRLAMVHPQSFYFYAGPLSMYELRKTDETSGKLTRELVDPPKNFPSSKEVKNGKKNAHAFLTMLCGEFRDRPTLIREKINWVNSINKLPVKAQRRMRIKDHVWSKMTAESYSAYINLSYAIYRMKEANLKASADANIVMGKYSEPAPVEPYTICETKYIFHNYIIPKKTTLPDYDKYMDDYKKFTSKCSQGDLAYYYDFRGDSNFKPNSPESNGMIWYSSTISGNCERKNGVLVLKEGSKDKFTNQNICEDYAKAPFAHRWMAARAGLAVWMFRSKEADSIFSNAKDDVTVRPNYDKLNTAFDYVVSSEIAQKMMPEWMDNRIDYWKRPDMGFNIITGLGTPTANTEMVFERLRDSVNRHTDWYASKYDDLAGQVRDQAYSPFVASSFEMKASDTFAQPGVTVGSPADGCKHWMFIFKIKKENWYSSKSVADKKPVNFNLNWFDETSLGTNSLADHERALDRLGTTLEGEMDSILYLNNLTAQGTPKENCGEGFVK